MRFFNTHIAVLLIALAGISCPAYSQLETFFTSFEFDDSGTFSIGEAPLTATFSGGSAQVIGIGAYYKSGTHSWHVPNGGMSTVTFETAAATVDFWFRDTAGAASSSYRIIDTSDAVIGSGNGTQSFVNVDLTRTGDQTRIARVEFDSAGGGDTVVDDFSFAGSGETVPPGGDIIEIQLGDPVDDQVYSGIASVSGWAVSSDGIEKVEVYIDGKYKFDAPYGRRRVDVGEQYPDILNSDESGFAFSLNYSRLGPGPHEVKVIAVTLFSDVKEVSANFTVQAFHEKYFADPDVVNLDSAIVSGEGNQIIIEGTSVDGEVYDIKLQWRTSTQGFEIIEIR